MDVRLLGAGDERVLDRVATDLFDNPVDAALTAELLNDPRHHLCVALDEGVVVAFASALHYVHPDKRAQLWINEVAVAPSHRRRGYATAVLDKLLSAGRALGCTEAWVLTEETNDVARSLYAAVGGTEMRTIMVTFPFPKEGTPPSP